MCMNDESTGQFLVYWETLHPSTVGRLWDVLCQTKCQFDEPHVLMTFTVPNIS